MKRIFILLLLFIACTNDDGQKRYFDYIPDQQTLLYVNVYPLGDISLENYEDMVLEANADYFNRYGIGVNFILQPRQALPQEIESPTNFRYNFFTETTDSFYEMNLWLIPNQSMPSGINGYAFSTSGNMVVREAAMVGTTVAHEIGHMLRLNHVPESDNTMYRFGNKTQTVKPRNFREQQIDTMLNTLTITKNIAAKGIEGIIID